MFKSLMQALWGGPYKIVFQMRGHKLILQSYKGKKSAPLGKVLAAFPPLRALGRILPNNNSEALVSYSSLETVKQALFKCQDHQKLIVEVSPEVMNLRQDAVPTDFSLTYQWSESQERLVRQFSNSVTYVGQGCFLSGETYWFIEGMNDYDKWFVREVIPADELLAFLRDVASRFERQGLPFSCDIRESAEPAFRIIVEQVHADEVYFLVDWVCDPTEVKPLSGLPQYVIADKIIRKGVIPERLPHEFRVASGRVRLTGQAIPHFLNEILPQVEPWTTGNIHELRQHHAIIPKGELILQVQQEVLRGIGQAVGIPTFVSGEHYSVAQELSLMVDRNTSYAKLSNGWVATGTLQEIGIGAMGRAIDGTRFQAIPLSGLDVIARTTDVARGIWTRVEWPDHQAMTTPKISPTFRQLDSLSQWSIPGGVVGEFDEVRFDMTDFLNELVSKHPEVQILVVGNKSALSLMEEDLESALRLEGLKKDPAFETAFQGIALVTPSALEKIPALLKKDWDCLFLLQADELVKTSNSKLFQNLVASQKRWIVGQFESLDFLRKTQHVEALSQVFGISKHRHGNKLWEKVTVGSALHASQSVRAIPAKTSAHQTTTSVAKTKPAEFTIGEEEPIILQIPSREHLQTEQRDRPFEISITVSTSHHEFLKQARERVDHREKQARFVPFMSYWPTYEDMTRDQQRWYFYWRSKVREGQYLDTDLSYIFVHVYEIINQIGVRDVDDGYRQLRTLWLQYRERFPKLDHYLNEWMVDYVTIYHCTTTALQVRLEALELNSPSVNRNILVESYVSRPMSEIPIFVYDLLTDYRIQESRFYKEGHQELVDKVLPSAMDHVDTYMVAKYGKGIFETFTPQKADSQSRPVFRSAIYGGPKGEFKETTTPYVQHQPLRDFLTSLVKHIENRLREQQDFKGRLRYSIEPEFQAVIDKFLLPPQPAEEVSQTEAVQAPSMPTRPEIKIDMEAVGRLRTESNDVMAMLVDEEEMEVPASATVLTATANRSSLEEPMIEETTLHQEVDDEWSAFFEQLKPYHVEALHAITNGSNVSAALSQIAMANAKMPQLLLDEINECTQVAINDLLIDAGPPVYIYEEHEDSLKAALLRRKGVGSE